MNEQGIQQALEEYRTMRDHQMGAEKARLRLISSIDRLSTAEKGRYQELATRFEVDRFAPLTGTEE